MDQAGLNYELPPRKTIEIIGSKQIPITVILLEVKKRVTIMSLVNCMEKKRQFIIFKGTYQAQICRKIQESNDESTYFSTQENA